MGETVHVEFERSYDVGAVLAVPSLIGVAGVERVDGPELVLLDALYFDTPELDLARSRVALRHRSGGADAGWHIKRAGADHRSEQQWPSAGEIPGEVPAEVLAVVMELTRGRELVPVARVRNSRRVSRLLRGDGIAVAEFCDDRVSAIRMADSRESTWREWEVELMASIAGQAAAERDRVLDAIEARLFDVGAAPSASGSKLARALGEHDQDSVDGRRAGLKREHA